MTTQRQPFTEDQESALLAKLESRRLAYNAHKIDWADPESIRQSSTLYNLFTIASRALDWN